MLGLGDFWVALVYILCIASALLCLVYGVLNWNRGGEPSPLEIKEGARWKKEEQKIEDKL
ncbi:hypothetical protein JW906_05705 [bacterium]|nr:hypothetical protein [bacterium]